MTSVCQKVGSVALNNEKPVGNFITRLMPCMYSPAEHHVRESWETDGLTKLVNLGYVLAKIRSPNLTRSKSKLCAHTHTHTAKWQDKQLFGA